MKNHVRMVIAGGVIFAAGLVIARPGAGQAQASAETKAPLAFEVISIKPADPNQPGGVIRPLEGGQTYVAINVPLRLMITLMYHITNSQLIGGPDWVNTDRWDIRAKAEKPSNIDELHEMFQTLFTDRFKLQFHRETKELPAFVLTVDKGGPKMKVSESTKKFEIPIQGPRGKLSGERVPMAYFSWFLSLQLNRPVVNQTGLDKNYDFTLEWTPDQLGPRPPGVDGGAPPPPSEGPTLFTALREQLGLKLESRKAPVEVFVIDSVEKPSAN